VIPGVGLADVTAALADDDGKLALPVEIVRDLRPDHRRVVRDLGAPDPEEDRRKLRDLALHAERHRLVVVVEIIAHGADDLFRARDHRQIFDVAERHRRLVPRDDGLAAGVVIAAEEVRERRVLGQGAAQVDKPVFDNGAPAFPISVQERQQLHGFAPRVPIFDLVYYFRK